MSKRVQRVSHNCLRKSSERFSSHHHHHHQCLASVFPCTHGSDVSPKIFLLHNCLSWASPTFKLKSFMSLLTPCNHVFLPLPLPTFPTTSTSGLLLVLIFLIFLIFYFCPDLS